MRVRAVVAIGLVAAALASCGADENATLDDIADECTDANTGPDANLDDPAVERAIKACIDRRVTEWTNAIEAKCVAEADANGIEVRDLSREQRGAIRACLDKNQP